MSSATTLQVTAEQRSMAGVYAWMVLGLGITGAVAWFAANTPAFIGFLQSSIWVLFGLFGVQLVVAIVLGMLVMRLPPAVTIVLFLVYSALTGLTISLFVLIYPIQAIVIALLVTAGIFGALSVYGFVTKRDLSGWGLFLFFGLLGLLLVSTINFFFVRSGWLDWALSVGGVLLFAGMTAYNTQQTKRRVAEARDAYGARQATIYGAFALYLNFINMFLRVLALTGRRR
ncbi:MAG: Bax inhibitor-1/YccA family protein [Oscillochloridaceae bacterium]|nr:Bax inhibitor-1/YccA family protein [Chloroflexaceae bacterium]MDW8389080.1 Bax inhibitor-1/YccA family protein [Oscillochloridaceae bacterium]